MPGPPRDDKVHLLVLNLGSADIGGPEIAQTDAAVLAADELRRSAGIARPGDRQRFLACRIALRKMLAHHTGAAASDVRFDYTSLGKPLLVHPLCPVVFSVSRSGDLGLIAVTASERDAVAPRLGVDIERVDPSVDALGVARTAFAAEEVAELYRCDDARRTDLFHRIWTQREAVAKALGVGLRIDREQLYVDVASGSAPRVVRLADGQGAPTDWTLRNLDASIPGNRSDVYQAALAVDRPLVHVSRIECSTLTELVDALAD